MSYQTSSNDHSNVQRTYYLIYVVRVGKEWHCLRSKGIFAHSTKNKTAKWSV